MNKPAAGEYNPYFSTYIDLIKEGSIETFFPANTETILDFFSSLPSEKADYRYAEGKWNFREILMHIIDVERVMSYRALAASRGDVSPLPTMDDQLYLRSSNIEKKTMEYLLDEFSATRNSTVILFEMMTDEQSSRAGNAGSHPITARALACIILGRPLHHINIIKERYLK